MKKALILAVVVLLVVSVVNVSSATVFEKENTGKVGLREDEFFAGGNGTAENPYLIENVTQLQNMNKNLSAHYELIDDIDASETRNWNNGTGFDPVGNSTLGGHFTGSLKGNGYEISNLYINRSSKNYVGLFGYIESGGVVRNVSMIDANITGNNYLGGLIGENGGAVNNSYSHANVSGSDYVGGLIGENGGAVNNSYSHANVSGDTGVGGLVAYNNGGIIKNTYATGNVSGGSYSGGLVGHNVETVKDSYYLDSEPSSAGTALPRANMTGASASENMSFDFVDTWQTVEKQHDDATEDGYPILRSLNRNTQLEAQDILQYHNLTVNIDGKGAVDIVPEKPEYEYGEKVNLTAVPDEGYQFVNWTGDYSGTERGIELIMDSNKTVTAHFEIKTYDLTVNTVGNGSVEIVPDKTEYDHGDEVNLSAVSDDGNQFVEWTGDYSGTEKNITITMDSDKELTAHFAIKTYNLTVNIVGNGSVEIVPDKTEYEHGEEVDLSAVPYQGNKFIEWTGDYSGIEKNIAITMDSDKEITAHFEIKTYTLTVDTVGNGSVDIEPDKTEYEHGEEVNLTANPDEGHEFGEWTGDHTGTDEQIKVTMNENKSITAHFEIKTYTLTVDTVGNGSVDIEPDKTEYEHGEEVNLTANPDEGYEFGEWTGDHTGTEKKTTITMTSDMVVEAHFLQEENFEIEITDYTDEIEIDEEMSVHYLVNNTGEADGEQQITFTVYDESGKVYENQTQISLESGEVTDEKAFDWTAQESGDYTIEIASEDDSSEVDVTVESTISILEVTSLTVQPQEAEAGEQIKITAEIINHGDSSSEFTAKLVLNGETIDTKSVSVDPDQTETVTFTHTINETGEYDVEVGGENASVDVVEDDGMPMTYVYAGIGVLALVVLLALIVRKGGTSDDYYDNTESHDLDEDKTLDVETEDESSDYELSEEDKDEIDLYG